jgi:hypothetical protein
MTRAWAVLVALLTAGALRAGLNNATLTGPGTVSGGVTYSLVLSVQNPGPGTVSNVSASLSQVPAGFNPVILSTPIAVAVLTPGSASFTWTFSGYGCGTADFSATVNGTESGPVSAGSNTNTVTLYCTPTPTPTPTPIVSPTPTPWVIYTSPPADGDARILGNLFRPLLGSPMQLQADLPEAGSLTVELYDRLGHQVKRFEQTAGPGSVTIGWDGRSDDGLLVSSGIYVAQFRARKLDKRVKFAVLK